MLVPVLLGAVLGGVLVLLVARYEARRRVQLLAIGLVVAALIYLAFARLAGGGGGRRLAIEAGGVVFFSALAWLGTAVAPVWLAIGWAAHAGWDIGLHLEPAEAYVPAWYPLGCLAFDLVVAGYALGLTSIPPRSRN